MSRYTTVTHGLVYKCEIYCKYHLIVKRNMNKYTTGGDVAQWVARLTRNVEVVGLNPIEGCCFIEQETLPILLSTGWFQERISA